MQNVKKKSWQVEVRQKTLGKRHRPVPAHAGSATRRRRMGREHSARGAAHARPHAAWFRGCAVSRAGASRQEVGEWLSGLRRGGEENGERQLRAARIFWGDGMFQNCGVVQAAQPDELTMSH